MIVFRFLFGIVLLVCEAFCICNYGFFEPYDTMYHCDNLNDVLQIQNKSIVRDLTVSNVDDVTNCDFPLLDGFGNLTSLTLEKGSLKKVTEECFKGAPKLYTIEATDQDINEFKVHDGLKSKLMRLQLYGNSFQKFDFENESFPELQLLALSRNNLTKFVLKSTQTPKLTTIGLGQNKIENFDIEAENLASFNFMVNRVKTFEGNRLIAPKLLILQFLYNNLTELTTNMIKGFPELLMGAFNQNPITVINFSSMNISSLNCYNDLISIKKSNRDNKLSIYVSWDAVREMNFSNNKISNLTIFNMEFELKVEELIMSDNLISEIRQKDLRLLRDLIMIDLSYNNISSIEDNAFFYAPKLHTILLKGNKLKSIHNSFLDNLNSIVSIDLSQNELKSFPVPGFDKNTEEIMLNSFHKIFLVQEIVLSGNPLSCSNQQLLKKWMSMYNHFVFHFDVKGNCTI